MTPLFQFKIWVSGLTSSSVEMASKGDLGIEFELEKFPVEKKICHHMK